MVLVDTNILLRLARPQEPEYPLIKLALRRLRQQQIPICYASQNLIELWSVFTRPVKRNGFGLTIEEADNESRLIESHLVRLSETDAIYDIWRRLVVQHRVSGRQVYDARLVAVMQVHGVSQILTFNAADFERYAKLITIINPKNVKQGAF